MITIKLTSRESLKAMKLLGITEQPFSESQLKSAFRKEVKASHEDKGGDKDKSREIIEAFEHLKPFAVLETAPEIARKLKKEISEDIKKDMFSLYKTCEKCYGTGNLVYTVLIKGRSVKKVKLCPFCRGVGKIKVTVFNPVIEKGALLYGNK